MVKPRILDLFCGAGGAAAGYARAGFDVVGVDVAPQPNYPFDFVQADALDVYAYALELDRVAAIHASPPCQAYSVLRHVHGYAHPDLVPAVRALLRNTGLPYVIENVIGAPLVEPILLCGSMFGLDIERHRLFECSFPVLAPPCVHGWQSPRFPPNRSGRQGRLARVITVAGHGGPRQDEAEGGRKARVEEWRRVMEIDWMSRTELAQAIPPAYTELLGYQLLSHLRCRAAS